MELDGANNNVDPSLYQGATLGRLIISAISRFGHRPALDDGHLRWTYSELGDAIGRIITVYKNFGFRRGDGFAMAVGNRAEQVAAQYAAVLMGLRYTALHLSSARTMHEFILRDAQISLLLVDPALPAANAAGFLAAVPSLRRVLSLGALEGADNLLDLMREAAPSPLEDEARPAEIVYLFYTGGTTGEPKGVMLPHRSIVTATLIQAADWDLPAGDIRFLAVTPTSHASGVIVHTVLMRGGLIRLMPGFDAAAVCKIIEAERINLTFLVPTMIYVLLESPARREADLSSLQTIIYGAAPMSPSRLEQALDVFGPVFVQLYGQTEAPMCVTTLRKADHDPAAPHHFGSAGLPAPSIGVALLDAEANPVADGELGEICVRGQLVMDGYWNRPEATEKALRGGWLHTGDIAIRSADGYFTIVDRTSDLIITGGFNVYPREVEDALLSHQAVSSAAVIGVADDKWGEAVTAFVVLRPGMAVDSPTLKQHVRDLRGPVWVPKRVEFIDSIPTTALGKVDRKALKSTLRPATQS